MNLTTLYAKVRFLLGELSSTQYSDTNLLRALNDYYHRAVALALRSAGEWEVNGEVATTNIVASQQEYILPTDLIALKRVEINFTGATNGWTVMQPLDMRQMGTAISNETVSSDSPRVRIFDNSLFLEDYPDTAVTAGLKIYYSKEESEISNASKTATTIAFVDSNPDTLTDSGNGFLTAGFIANQNITVSGSTSNDGTYKIDTVAAGTITLTAGASLTAEAAGDTVTLTSNTEPDLEESTVSYIIYGACLDYAIAKGMNNEINTFKALLNESTVELEKVYSNRLPMRRPRITTKSENYS